MAEKKLIGKCPVCRGSLYISELSCRECDVKIRGDFEIPPFSRLNDDERDFLAIFLRSRGSLRDVQRELALSYPTVRSRLDALLAKMGIISAGPSKEEIDEVLDRLEAGDLSAEEAVRLIRREDSEAEPEILRIKEAKAAEALARLKEKEEKMKEKEAEMRAREEETKRKKEE